jgi:hypothetical protein
MWTEGQRKNIKEEGDENNEQFCNTEIQRGGHSLSVLNQGTEGWEEKIAGDTGRPEKRTKKWGERKEKKLVNNKGKGRTK